MIKKLRYTVTGHAMVQIVSCQSFVKSQASQCGIPGKVALKHAFLCQYHSTKLHTYI